ncbi:adhesion G-protein coupled receptor D1-like [Lytechinus pictus]|uniref:adhesion G-protein coupled receptor D1-like n=2 Tax=Lytechinus pictus TaxID=7653 RepID=UPI0030B9B68C
MTGTYIGSNKPISVIVGAFNVFIPRETNTRNKGHGVVMELLLPISAWGRTHIVPPFRDTPNGWILRISAINSSTNVSLTNCEITGNVTKLLNSREFADITVNGTNQRMCLIEADQSIQVMQYVAGSRTSPEEFGDPSMTVIPAVSRYHGDTSVSKVRKREFNYTMDVVTTSKNPPMINDPPVVHIGQTRSLIINGTQFFLYTFELPIGIYQVTRRNQSDRMWVRLYTLHNSLGAAMLGDVGVSVRNNDKITDIKGKNDELKKKQKEFETRFPHDFPSYDAAAEALDTVTSYLVDKGELDSVIETEVALEFFKGVLTRKPLLNATVNETKSFLNKTSEALNVLFSNKTNEHLVRACVEKRNLSVSPEQIQYELEGLLHDASELIAGGGLSSFDVSRENAAIAIAPTTMTSRGNSATAAECGGALGITGYGAEIPCEVLKEMGSRAVYQMRLPFGADALASSKCSENRKRIATSLLSVGLVSNQPKREFSKNVSLTFNIRPSEDGPNNDTTLCSFWDNEKGDWSTSGCTLDSIDVIDGETEVTCLCNHLTSFAVLIDVTPGSAEIDPRHEQIMKLLTWIGCGFSIVACFLTCFGYAILRLRSDLILVHGNLALSVGLAETAFLCLGAISDPDARPISCLILASLIYYHFIAMFAWMAIEGVHLYLLTFVVWNAEKRKIKWYMACGWGIPFLFVAMMLAYNFIRHERYEQGIDFQNYCFLSMEDRSLLMFVVPVAVVIVFNIFVTIRVVCQIVKMSDGPTMQGDIKKRAKYGVKAMIVLLPIMGLTWVVGFLAVNRAKVIFLYAFIVLNCLQGVFIFFIHFFRNTEVRKAFRRQLDKWAVSQSFKGDSSSSRNGRKSSSSGGEKNLAAFRSPNQTVTLSNMSSTRAHNL